MVEIWFGILKRKCLSYGHFRSVAHLTGDIDAFIETWNAFFAHPFTWSYNGEGLHAKAVRRFARLLAVETDQMECGFLRNQLLLTCSIAENNIDLIPDDDWLQLVRLATEKDRYITTIIADETGPSAKKTAQAAYERFRFAVTDHVSCPTRAA